MIARYFEFGSSSGHSPPIDGKDKDLEEEDDATLAQQLGQLLAQLSKSLLASEKIDLRAAIAALKAPTADADASPTKAEECKQTARRLRDVAAGLDGPRSGPQAQLLEAAASRLDHRGGRSKLREDVFRGKRLAFLRGVQSVPELPGGPRSEAPQSGPSGDGLPPDIAGNDPESRRRRLKFLRGG